MLVFHFSTYCPSSFIHLSHLLISFWMPDAKNDAGCCPSHWGTTDCTLVSDVNFCQSSIFFIWSRKTLVALHWTHLRVNLICIKSFCPQNIRITPRCLLWDAIFIVYKWRHSDIIIIKLTAGTQNEIPYKMYILDFLYLKTNRAALFCNLFIERPLYYCFHHTCGF